MIFSIILFLPYFIRNYRNNICYNGIFYSIFQSILPSNFDS